MKISAFVVLVLICENTFCLELEPVKDEAVFQGKCSSNLCSQLCYELHDGMFECDCTHGYELNLDGYGCKLSNISTNVSFNELSVDEDYSTSDVFYQKDVLFSAKLDEAASNSNLNVVGKEFINNDVDNQSNNSPTKAENFQRLKSSEATVNIPRFYQTSWLAFRPLKGANLVIEINIEFRPEQTNGILLLSGEREDLNGDFMIVTLTNGIIEFFFDCGSGKGVIKSSEKVILNQWNSLLIYRYRWDAWIELNEKRRNRGRSNGIFSRITFRSPVFLGGKGNLTAETLARKKIHTSKGFSGCIRKFVVNGHQYELSKLSSEIISTSNLNECALDQCSFVKCLHGGRCQSTSCLCPLGFGGKFCEKKLYLKTPLFNGTSYLRYSPLGESAIIWLEIKLVIKPQREDGLILFSGKNDLGDFIALYLNFGFVEFIYDLGSGVTSVKSKFPLSTDEWHVIKISRTARLAVMKVDAQPEVMTVSPNGFWHLSLPYSLYLGGVAKLNSLPSNLRERGFFVGCIKQFEVNDRNIEMIEDALGGFDVDNCNETCIHNLITENSSSSSSDISKSMNPDEGITDINIGSKSSQKYAFDVVDDASESHDNSLSYHENEDNGNSLLDDTNHKRIVRVSLQKAIRRDQGACFRGNESYALYDLQKIITPNEFNENSLNIRFKTLSPNGLMLLIYQKTPKKHENFVALSVEDGYMHLRYNQGSINTDITLNGTKINDGLWHRVRATKKNQKGSLRIDGGQTVTARARAKQKFFEVTSGLYLGGTSSSSIPGFNGCISDIILSTEDGEHHLDLNMFRAEDQQNVNFNENL